MVEGSDIYGDGVNVAARLEAMAEPGGICVSGRVYEEVSSKLDLGFDDLGEQSLKNISRPVRVYRVAGMRPSEPIRSLRSRDKPSIAVLPFANMSGDPEQEFFVDGLTEDIITALSRISALWVIARNSTFTYKGKPIDVKRVAQELGVRYVMEGSVRRAGERLRVTAQLIDAATGHHVWAERYDRRLADLFDIQDEITRSVVASTETQVLFAELQAAKSRPSTDLRARDLVARAWARSYDLTPEAIAEASDLVEEAIRIDPSNPTAHRTRALIFLCRFFVGETLHDAASKARAFELARTALRLAPRDEYAHLAMAWAWAYAATGGLEEAVAECERGLEINPNCSLILGNQGAYLAALGRPQEAIAACRLSLQLNPRDPSNFWRSMPSRRRTSWRRTTPRPWRKASGWPGRDRTCQARSSGQQRRQPWGKSTKPVRQSTIASPSARTCGSATSRRNSCCGSRATGITNVYWRCCARPDCRSDGGILRDITQAIGPLEAALRRASPRPAWVGYIPLDLDH